jgi:hypothetical protein
VLYSRQRTAGHDAATVGGGEGLSKFLFKGLWMLPAMAALHTLASGRTPDEDKDETYPGMIGKDLAAYPFSALPMGGEISRAIMDAASGKPGDIQVSSPILKAMESTIKAGAKTEQWYNDEAEFEDVAREVIKTSGYWLGAPTDQLELSGGYAADLVRSKTDPNDMFELMHDLLWRRPKSRR